MRNLKKILALVLALVMSMSLLTVANAFSDDESINETYLEAAEVLAGLKVLQGRPDGSFDPKANINRGEMAAIIYRIVTTDVTDAQTSIYAESSKLSDVPGTWSAGYVGFCNNSNLIMGYPDGTFQQNKNVTGHEALAMLLRAIGYGKNGEFQGKDWAINTAIYAKMNGLLKNINESTLSQPATREMVAEMAFRALVAENVNWSLGLNYQPANKTLADGFNLKEFEGVITANKYADLYGASGVKGTVLNDEDSYDWDTDLTMMGMNYRGWSCGKNNTVIFFEDNGNNVFEPENGVATAVTKAKVGMGVNNAEEFINFGGDDDAYTSDVKIKYILENLTYTAVVGEDDDEYDTVEKAKTAVINKFKALGKTITAADVTLVDTNEYGYTAANLGNTIYAGDQITKDDIARMKLIFREADRNNGIFEKGEVYVMTTSEKDISDEISWKAFEEKYIIDETNFADVDSSDNGEWLKVIDNDGDGSADYIFRTDFTVSMVTDIDKKGNITIPGVNNDDYDVVYAEDVAEGDVVLYTFIDGVYYVNIAESFEAEVKTYSWKNDSITTKDGDVYYQSGITNSNDSDYELLYTDLEDALDDVGYAFFKDHFGYVAAFDELTVTNGLKLLTDGYYTYGYNKKDVYKVEYWDNEAQDFARAGVNVTGSVSLDAADPAKRVTIEDFIDDTNGNVLDREGWLRLYGAVADAWTNVAALSVNDEVATVKHVNAKSNKTVTDIYELDWVGQLADGTDGFAAKDQMLKMDGSAGQVLVNSKTTFYYVYFDQDKTMTVTEKTGWQNSLKVEDEVCDINAAYAAATTTHAYVDGTTYPVADVVVVEIKNPLPGASKMGLLYSVDQRSNGEVRGLKAILGTNPTEPVTFGLDNDWTKDQYEDLGDSAFTYRNFIGKDTKLTEAPEVTDYRANGIYASTIDAAAEILTDDDYRYVVLAGKTETLVVPLDTPILTFSANKNGTYDVDYENELKERDKGNKIIWVKNVLTDEVQYIINVNESRDASKNIIAPLNTLWTAINTENGITPPVEQDIGWVAREYDRLMKDDGSNYDNDVDVDQIDDAEALLAQIDRLRKDTNLGITNINWLNSAYTVLNNAITVAKELKTAQDNNKTALETALLNAIKAEATTQGVTINEATVLAEDTTTFNFNGNSIVGGSDTVKGILTYLKGDIDRQAIGVLDNGTDHTLYVTTNTWKVDRVATLYVAAVKKAQTDNADYQAQADAMAGELRNQTITLGTAITAANLANVETLVNTELANTTTNGGDGPLNYNFKLPAGGLVNGKNTFTQTITVAYGTATATASVTIEIFCAF